MSHFLPAVVEVAGHGVGVGLEEILFVVVFVVLVTFCLVVEVAEAGLPLLDSTGSTHAASLSSHEAHWLTFEAGSFWVFFFFQIWFPDCSWWNCKQIFKILENRNKGMESISLLIYPIRFYLDMNNSMLQSMNKNCIKQFWDTIECWLTIVNLQYHLSLVPYSHWISIGKDKQ